MAAVPTSDGARARARWVLVTQLAAWTVFAVGLAGPLTATAGDPPASTLALFVGIPIALLLASARRAGRWLLVPSRRGPRLVPFA